MGNDYEEFLSSVLDRPIPDWAVLILAEFRPEPIHVYWVQILDPERGKPETFWLPEKVREGEFEFTFWKRTSPETRFSRPPGRWDDPVLYYRPEGESVSRPVYETAPGPLEDEAHPPVPDDSLVNWKLPHPFGAERVLDRKIEAGDPLPRVQVRYRYLGERYRFVYSIPGEKGFHLAPAESFPGFFRSQEETFFSVSPEVCLRKGIRRIRKWIQGEKTWHLEEFVGEDVYAVAYLRRYGYDHGGDVCDGHGGFGASVADWRGGKLSN